MERKEILEKIIEFSDLHSLRILIANSKMLQQTVFKGFRPQSLTKKEMNRLLLRPIFIYDEKVYEMFCEWWRKNHAELIDEQLEEKEQQWGALIKRWSAPKVWLAIVLSNLDGREGLMAEFSESVIKDIANAGNQTAAASNTAKHINIQEHSKLTSRIDKSERRLADERKRNQNLSKLIKSLAEQNKTLQANLAFESSRLEIITKSHKELNEKVRLLEKTNRDLVRQVKLLKTEAASKLTELKVVLVDYLDLGDNLNERKSSLLLLNDLLCSPEGMTVDAGNRPSMWLEKASIKAFWKREGNKVTVLCRPADHLLLNIGQLMEDFLHDQGCQN